MNDMLNSLYELPVPKPFTPVNLSVVGTRLISLHRRHTTAKMEIKKVERGDRYCSRVLHQSRW